MGEHGRGRFWERGENNPDSPASGFFYQSKVEGPAQGIQFLGVKWQDGCRQIPTEVIIKIAVLIVLKQDINPFVNFKF